MKFKLGGQLRELNFGLRVLGQVQQDCETDLAGLGQLMATSNLFLLIPSLVHRGHNLAIKDTGESVTIEEVNGWIKEDGIFNPELQKALAAFIESVSDYLPKEKEAEPSKKK